MTQRLRIEGRGPVAIALRLFLARQGFAPSTIAHEAFAEPIPAGVAARPLALSLGSTHLLSRIVALPEAAPIRTVDVSLAHHGGRTRIHAADLDSPTLGCVTRYAALHDVLVQALRRVERTTRAPSRFAPHASSEPGEADEIVVRADGDTRSPSARTLDFDQCALLAEVVVERDAPGVAFEHFTAQGPLALLPLPETRRRALVWCSTPQQTARRALLPPREFDDELLGAFGPALGTLRLAGERHRTPLQRRLAPREANPRCVAIGNAAQALHPVAGQGLNLGLRDAFELAQELGTAHAHGMPLENALVRFRRRRIGDRAATVGVTDTLARLFGWTALAPIQSVAFDVLDWSAPLRDRFAKALMFGLRSG
ncbi:MAG: FAD-dependent monooxygenase [Burkholderiaceae bacterium]|nr:FAD-dependent monooxygenase [Burkholderiaceae bacterium]